jgi:hypothetical protein
MFALRSHEHRLSGVPELLMALLLSYMAKICSHLSLGYRNSDPDVPEITGK